MSGGRVVVPDVLAAVDLGSNSFHMVVARYSHGQLVILDRLREMVRLAAGLGDSGRLDDTATDRALRCLERFGQRLRAMRAESVRVVGTNALRRAKRKDSAADPEQYLWEMAADFQKVPAGESMDVFVEYSSRDAFQKQIETGHALSFVVQAQTAEKILWLLMPEGKEYRSWGLIRDETGKPEAVEAVQPVTEYLAQDYTILAFKLLALKPGFTYEVRWTYKD